MTTLTQEQREALRNAISAGRVGTRAECDAAADNLARVFADALRPPKMATRWHDSGKGVEYRVERTQGGADRLYWKIDNGRVMEPVQHMYSAAILAAARDEHFHPVTD
jgi:hypothetical protein